MNNLKEACILQNNSWIAEIPDILPQPDYSKKHIKAINRLKNKMQNDRYHRLTVNTFRVLVAAAVILALTVTAFAIPATRNYIIEKFDKYSTVIFSSDGKSENIGTLEPGYIPEGFELSKEKSLSKLVNKVYVNNTNDFVSIKKCFESSIISFDTEENDYEEIIINDRKYIYYCDSNGNTGLIWADEKYTYSVNTSISFDETIKIAENIK